MAITCSESFISSLTEGILRPLFQRIKNDLTLDIELRQNDEIEVYYRGAQLLRISENKIYKKGNSLTNEIREQVSIESVQKIISLIPTMKNDLDNSRNSHSSGPKGAELETEQIIVRENNHLKALSQNTDYTITDIEHETAGYGRFDLVAVKSLKDGKDRSTAPKKVAIIELKYGVSSLADGKASLKSHFSDVQKFIQDGKLQELELDTKYQYNFKFKLDLFDKGTMKLCPEDHIWEKPEYIILLANYDVYHLDGEKDIICVLKSIREDYPLVFDAFDVRFATSCGMGYCLYNNCLLTYDQFKKYLGNLGKNKAY